MKVYCCGFLLQIVSQETILPEFHVHGSNAVISAFLKVLSEQENCRLAEPGEFTKLLFKME